jgi:hypothetical protein
MKKKTVSAAELEKLQQRIDTLQKILNKKKQLLPENSALLKAPKKGNVGWGIQTLQKPDGFLYFAPTNEHLSIASDNSGNAFATKGLADLYSQALNTLLLLRRQLGTQPPSESAQTLLTVKKDKTTGNFVIHCSQMDNKITKLCHVSPCFQDKDLAMQAVNSIGEQRILHMFRTLHGYFERA